jgi:membrane-associated PAP2 superfamily phosphatase
MSPVQAWLRRDLIVTLVALALLLVWDFSGLDLQAAQRVGSAQGFAARDAWWASTLAHSGGRAASWCLLLVLVGAALFTPRHAAAASPARHERWFWLVVMLLCALLVPSIKRFSATSCPWDLVLFGGVAQYISHWQIGVADGGSGRCFPSGHAVVAFTFFGLYFMWRPHNTRRAHAWLLVVLLVGAFYGTAQWARGAHYPSHTLWSAWLCWAFSAAAAAWFSKRERRLASSGG